MYICVYCLTQTRTVTYYKTDPSCRQGGRPMTNKIAAVLITIKICSCVPMGARRQDWLTDRPSFVMWFWHWVTHGPSVWRTLGVWHPHSKQSSWWQCIIRSWLLSLSRRYKPTRDIARADQGVTCKKSSHSIEQCPRLLFTRIMLSNMELYNIEE